MLQTDSSATPPRWALNAIVLHHTQRYFNAVTRVIRRWKDPDRELTGELIALVGNVLWAQSPYITQQPATEEMLALGGALAATFGEKLGTAEDEARELSLRLVSRYEHDLHQHYDRLLDELERDLAGLDFTQHEVNQWVWDSLFPLFPYDLSQSELEDAIHRQLGG